MNKPNVHERCIGGVVRTRNASTLVMLASALAACAPDASSPSRGRGAINAPVDMGRSSASGAAPELGQSAGGAPQGTTLIAAQGPTPGPSTEPLENCDPGSYTGTYECYLVQQGEPTDTKIEGVVAFDLEINQVMTMQAACPAGQEF